MVSIHRLLGGKVYQPLVIGQTNDGAAVLFRHLGMDKYDI